MKNSKRRQIRIQTRTDRRVRKRAERAAKQEVVEIGMMREEIARIHADLDTTAEAEEIGDLKGWRDDLAWIRHNNNAFNWTEGWDRPRLAAELARLRKAQRAEQEEYGRAIAAIVLVMDGKQVLSVTHAQGYPTGYPGGKRESNETARQCAVRELREETGLIVDAELLRPLYLGSADGTLCAAYWVPWGACRGKLRPEPGLGLLWTWPAAVTSSPACRYPEYNRVVAARLAGI